MSAHDSVLAWGADMGPSNYYQESGKGNSMNKTLVFFLSAGLLIAVSSAYAGGNTHWGYTEDEGPDHWGELAPEFKVCSSGKNQSPINLTDFIEAELPTINFNYGSNATEILNNGHTIQANYGSGSTISIGGHIFELKQFHFHTPSENHINGKSFPMEAHLVHADKEGNLAVIAVVFETTQVNETIAAMWRQMPEKAGERYQLSSKVNASSLLPSNRDYYRFNGSLTTPPCTEGVWWLMMKKPVSVSKDQVDSFTHVIHHPNNRPVQPTNARPVLQ
jgi:carbonic anhydrase